MSLSKPKVGDKLSRREHEVLTLLCSGLHAQAVADRLSVSKRTVGFHTYNAYTKLGVDWIVPAYNEMMRRGLVEAPVRRQEIEQG